MVDDSDIQKPKKKTKSKKSKRKTPYVAGIGALNFRPTYDWERNEAKKLYLNSNHSVPTDKISYIDCIEGMKEIPENSIDLIIADPPFGIDFSGKEAFYNRKSELVTDGYNEINGEYDYFTIAWISQLPRIMKESSSGYIFSGWTNLKDVLIAIDHAGLTIVNHIIWKYQFGVFTKRKYVSSHYHVLFIVKDPKKYFFNKIEHYPEDVWIIPRKYKPGQEKNGTKLPEELVARCINFSSKPGDIVFDPFMGNGTTAVTAKANFRHYYGFEINENMRDLLIKNIDSVEIGEDYISYKKLIPSAEELGKKYPAVKRIAESKKLLKNKTTEK